MNNTWRRGLRHWAALAACSAVAALAQAQPAPVTMPAEKVNPAPVPVEVPANAARPGAPAMPATPATSPAPAAPGDGAPLVRTDMRHRCGGISSDESSAWRAQMKDHPLSLLFAQEGGAYLADVDVAIQGGTGNQPAMLFRASGPICLVDLPAGSYQVQATRGGVVKRESVTVGSGAKTVDFRFP